MVPWPSGKAKVCNTSIPGSIPGDASSKKSTAIAVLFLLEASLLHRAGFSCALKGARKPVRIRCSEIGKRLAQRGIFQAESARILANGEIPGARGAQDGAQRLTNHSYYAILQPTAKATQRSACVIVQF